MTAVDQSPVGPSGARRPEFHLSSISLRLSDAETNSLGWDLNHPYLETFWLPVIGPTSTVLLRYVGRHVRTTSYKPFSGEEIGQALGLSRGTGRNSALAKTFRRLAHFGLVVYDSAEDDPNFRITVPSRVPPLTSPRVQKLPEHLRILHSRAIARQHLTAARAVTSWPAAGAANA